MAALSVVVPRGPVGHVMSDCDFWNLSKPLPDYTHGATTQKTAILEIEVVSNEVGGAKGKQTVRVCVCVCVCVCVFVCVRARARAVRCIMKLAVLLARSYVALSSWSMTVFKTREQR
jgi:hypothetical protein